jgi:hypothetical protein
MPHIPVPVTHHWNCSSLKLVYNLNIKPKPIKPRIKGIGIMATCGASPMEENPL